MSERLWECQRVRAGPLVKEIRMIRPRMYAGDSAEDRREKEWIKSRCALNRDATDRLELRLALFGWCGVHYTLSFDDRFLPPNYAGVQREMENFFARCWRWRKKSGKLPSFDYIRCIEGLHGDHRYHVHFVCNGADFSGEDIQRLWRRGGVHSEPVLLEPVQGYRRLARYFRKERNDGITIPLDKNSLTWSASLAVPEARCSMVRSGIIRIPADVLCCQKPSGYHSEFGSFNYAKYILPDASRACARARTILERGGYVPTFCKKGDESH